MGTSVAECLFEIIYRDHPHAYGDKSLAPVGGLSGNGSSPRVWGQDELDNLQVPNLRIIPTRMGTRSSGGNK